MCHAIYRQHYHYTFPRGMRRVSRPKRQPWRLRHFDFGDDIYFEEWMMACPVESVTS